MTWVYDDGGREAAGYRGEAGDCATRAAAIALSRPYAEVYDELAARNRATGRPRSARDGVSMPVMRAFMAEAGWAWTPTMQIGSGCRVHLRADELPGGRIIARCSRHFVAVLDGVIHDTFDSSRDGTRCVYGFWLPQGMLAGVGVPSPRVLAGSVS